MARTSKTWAPPRMSRSNCVEDTFLTCGEFLTSHESFELSMLIFKSSSVGNTGTVWEYVLYSYVLIAKDGLSERLRQASVQLSLVSNHVIITCPDIQGRPS